MSTGQRTKEQRTWWPRKRSDSLTRRCPWGGLTWNGCGGWGRGSARAAGWHRSVVWGSSLRSAVSRAPRETGEGAASTLRLLPAVGTDGMEAGSPHCWPRTHRSPSPHPPAMAEGGKKSHCGSAQSRLKGISGQEPQEPGWNPAAGKPTPTLSTRRSRLAEVRRSGEVNCDKSQDRPRSAAVPSPLCQPSQSTFLRYLGFSTSSSHRSSSSLPRPSSNTSCMEPYRFVTCRNHSTWKKGGN